MKFYSKNFYGKFLVMSQQED